MRLPGGVPRIPKTLALTGAALLLSPVLLEAILVAPHAVFMDHRSRTGQVFLVNTGDAPEEVDIDLRFGYPDADSNGTVFIRLIDQPDATEPSAASLTQRST